MTAQLIRLESRFDPRDDSTVAEGPGRVRLFLERLAARVTPSFEEEAVFAYQNPATESDQHTEPVTEGTPEKPEDGN